MFHCEMFEGKVTILDLTSGGLLRFVYIRVETLHLNFSQV